MCLVLWQIFLDVVATNDIPATVAIRLSKGAQELVLVVVRLDMEFSPITSCFLARFGAVEHKGTITCSSKLVSCVQLVAHHIQGISEQAVPDPLAVTVIMKVVHEVWVISIR